MKRLHEPNRVGGYPVTGEALEILGVDMPNYVNAILDDFTPDNSIVFLGGDYAYCKIPSTGGGTKEIMKVIYANDSGLNKVQLINGANFAAQVSHGPGYSDTVNGTTYTFTREDVILYIRSSSNTAHPSVFTLDTLIKSRYAENVVDYFDSIQAAHNGGRTLQMAGVALIRTNPVTETQMADINLVFKYQAQPNSEDGELRVDLPSEFLTASPIVTECYCNNPNIKPDAVLDATEIKIEAPGFANNEQYVVIHLILHYPIVMSFDNWRTFNAG